MHIYYVKIYPQLDTNRHHTSAKIYETICLTQSMYICITVTQYIDPHNRVKLEALNANITP